MKSTEPQKVLEQLGDHFRSLRLARNVSQESLASESGVGLSTLKRLENGRGCNLVALVQLMIALNCEARLESFFLQLATDAGGGALPAEKRRRASSVRSLDGN
ncbi:Helix-turn-helix domain-containing protein [Microbulbifer donghaiensis]|uniref:Helix-turn-helix domain-containing protein n=1 Tax=Microbulbifer donghaiensis TaxID=494016 RepID=A0A1M4W1K2_9GAMM|nr:helix-turn-helix transcriptional regulator [Microbulbifer donghaiensis]SHE74832.1 Helix-turn-helix domain-containing protein [Microbulbifer donghaiensis]